MVTAVRDRLSSLATPTLFEADPSAVMALDAGIRPVFRPVHMAGPAFTVSAEPGDNLALHRALAEARGGDVLVVVTGGDCRHGFFGEVMMEAAIARGIGGLVIDGGVRDTAAFRAGRFPVFAGGIAIPGTAKRAPGTLQEPVTIAGCTLRPGDWIVGDDDGVVAVPGEGVEAVIGLAEARVTKEAGLIERIRSGETTMDVLNLRASGKGARHGA